MAKFEFKLENYLNIKERLEEYRKQEYGMAVSELEEYRREKDCLEALKKAYIDDFRQSLQIKKTPFEFQNYNNYINSMKDEIQLIHEKICESENKVKIKNKELELTSRDRKVIDRLKEKEYEEFQNEEKIIEQKILDEIINYGNHNRRI